MSQSQRIQNRQKGVFRMSKIIFCLLLLAFFPINGKAQSHAELLQGLLDLPAAPKFDGEDSDADDDEEEVEYPKEFFSRLNPPPDDAPLKDLLAYWSKQSKNNRRSWNRFYASEKSTRRILDYCKEDILNLSE